MLQDLWHLDQLRNGLKPQRWTGPHTALPAHLWVDETTLSSGTVQACKLFPLLEWPSSGKPNTYKAFEDLIEAYRDAKPDLEAHERSFLSVVCPTEVMQRARTLINQRGNDEAWTNFARDFWFSPPQVRTDRSSRASARGDSFRDLLQRYSRRDESTLSVNDAIELLAHKTGIDSALFDEPLATMQAQIDQKRKDFSPQQEASGLLILDQMIRDLRYIHELHTGARKPFLHVFVGEYYESTPSPSESCLPLLGYHFWYKFYQDAYALPDMMTAESLMYGGTLCSLGKETPELTTFAFSLRLEVEGGGTLCLRKEKGGFLNGCSPEGWMALCMVAFHRALRNRPNMLEFKTASGEVANVELAVESVGDQLTTAYPVLWGSSP